LRTPIESGCYTHLTFTHRFINGTTLDEVVLYKNGRVAASGLNVTGGASNALALNNTTLVGRALTIGGGDNANAGTNNYGGTCGWNHLVSGAYVFRRVLSEGEILDLHNGQTLQPLVDNIKAPIKVELTDDKLLAYYAFRNIGWPDASKYHRPLVCATDEGLSTSYVPVPGPFKGGAMLQNGSNVSRSLVATSGLIYDMLNARSWTIGMVAGPTNGLGRPSNMMFSMGSVSATTSVSAPAAITTSTFGMAFTEFGAANRLRFSAYPLGDITASVFNMDTATSGFYRGVSHHYAVAYDDSTKGLAVYVDGHLQGSGTLAHSLTDQLVRLAGSGYPLMFANGISDAILDSTTHGVLAAGGQDMFLGPIMVMGRAMLPEEIMYVAQSGIDTTSTWRTLYDPRLVGYWPCSDFKLDDVVVEDRARVWDTFPGNLIRGDTTAKWSAWYTLNQRTNQFGTRTTPPELASYGVLGISSGVFGVHGLSPGTSNVTDAASARSSIANLSLRYKPVNCESTTTPQNVLGDFVLAFEVTPSGTIPSTQLGLTGDNAKFEFNSTLSLYGNLGASITAGELRSFLTTIDAAQGSGVSLVFASRTGTFSAANYTGLVSGVLPYGVPSKVLFHSKMDAPYNVNGDAAGATPVTVTLWINGVAVARRRMTAATARIWTDETPDSATDDYLLEFGGEAGNDTITTTISRDGGLGDLYMREIFLMRGTFDKGEIEALAVSGIQSPTITGYTPTLPKTQVTVFDSALQGYWRFNGLDGGGSGTTDLSFKLNHLAPLSEQKNRAGTSTQSSRSFKFLPGPLKDSDLLVQCSGLTYGGADAGGAAITPPFAVSGVEFDSPQDGFSVGFFMSRRVSTTANTANPMLVYGVVNSNVVASTTTDFNRGWAILSDDNNDIKMVMSVGGGGYYDNASNASQSGQIVCGTFDADSIYEDNTRFNNYMFGHTKPARLDFWSHYCWTYDPTIKELKCYVNGQEVDRKATKFAVDPLNGGPPSGLNPIVPVNPAVRMITFLTHQNAGPWDFSSSNLTDEGSVITDVFYFSRALTEPEVRYISQNGIDGADGTIVSGVVGGYILGSELVSGIIGGYNRGQDTGSGIIGGYDFGAFDASGIIGGYVSGVIFFNDAVSGIVGGYIRALDTGSGILGGYIRGADQISGIIGGFVLGGLVANMQFDGGFTVQAFAAKDFDSQITLRKDTTADFDAKLVIFQAETGPLVDIIVPNATLGVASAPFNQYLVGAASGTQGKSIVQTRWTFGDLTPAVTVAQSGAGFFPVQHYYAGSGFFIAKFEAIDSNGIHGSATRIINAASGIDPVIVSLSGVPRSGNAALTVDFTMTVDILPPGVAINTSLLSFDDGQSTITFNPTHIYSEPGTYKPIWCVRDSRGVIWCDSLEAGNDFLKGI
jgi:PKD repeat protein